jgi:hypothetical protein
MRQIHQCRIEDQSLRIADFGDRFEHVVKLCFLKGSANLLLLPRLAESLAEPLAKLWEMEFTPA